MPSWYWCLARSLRELKRYRVGFSCSKDSLRWNKIICSRLYRVFTATYFCPVTRRRYSLKTHPFRGISWLIKVSPCLSWQYHNKAWLYLTYCTDDCHSGPKLGWNWPAFHWGWWRRLILFIRGWVGVWSKSWLASDIKRIQSSSATRNARSKLFWIRRERKWDQKSLQRERYHCPSQLPPNQYHFQDDTYTRLIVNYLGWVCPLRTWKACSAKWNDWRINAGSFQRSACIQSSPWKR